MAQSVIKSNKTFTREQIHISSFAVFAKMLGSIKNFVIGVKAIKKKQICLVLSWNFISVFVLVFYSYSRAVAVFKRCWAFV